MQLDSDVEDEEERIAKLGKNKGDDEQRARSEGEAVSVYNLRKVYTKLCGKPFPAVERISFGLDYGECFALLGVNGAGKTTTFKSLTRDVIPTSGELSIAGFDVRKDFSEGRKQIGYCPQHNALFDLLSVEEHLWFYAKIKGIPPERRKE